ncbi:MAG: NBR1-Ig-like domain-containing protein [Chloroflexota bacterium]
MDTPHSQKKYGVSIFLIPLFMIFFSGCNLKTSPQSPYVPPTSANLSTAQLVSKSPPLLPSPTFQSIPTNLVDDCSDDLLYIGDITIPDGTNLDPGIEADKQWQVKNNGTCDWDYRYSLRMISGDGMGTEKQQSLYPARAGSQVVIQLTFTTPLQAGTYQSVWQAFNAENQSFGDPISILLVVVP